MRILMVYGNHAARELAMRAALVGHAGHVDWNASQCTITFPDGTVLHFVVVNSPGAFDRVRGMRCDLVLPDVPSLAAVSLDWADSVVPLLRAHCVK
jgi:hypothetical protein